MTAAPQPSREPQQPDPNLDLGFGSVLSRETPRLLNRDGTFNVRREGLGPWERLNFYHYSLTMSWPRFLVIVGAGYFLTNAIFALAYMACGPHAVAGITGTTAFGRFLDAFFFSVETLATIGYGNIVPASFAADVLVTAESLAGLLGFSVIAGIVFARFARPIARIVFSRCAVVAPYRDITAFMFRVVNMKSSEIVELEAKVLMTRRKREGSLDREYIPMKLERERVVFFPATWTVVHPIDEKSPLWGMTPEAMRECDTEFLVLLNGFDETFSQNVHARSSYRADEVVWGARFRSAFNPPRPDGRLSVDIRKLDEIDRVPLPVGPRNSET